MIEKILILIILFTVAFFNNTQAGDSLVVAGVTTRGECLEKENSCPVDFLQELICAMDDKNCTKDNKDKVFSWGLTSSYNWDIISAFVIPNDNRVPASSAKEQADFIDHEMLEYLICSRFDPAICNYGSIYKADNSLVCKKYPDVCSDNSSEKPD